MTSITGGPLNGATYTYDANGNLTQSVDANGTRVIAFSSFNMVTSVSRTASAASAWFGYGPEHQRVSGQHVEGGTTTNIHYVHPNNEGGLLFEREFVGSATTNKHYIIGGGGVVALVRTGSVTSTEYWHKDALGSVVVRTDAAGVVIAGSRRAFDPWGKASPGADGYRGFTEHEQFDTLGFVHMNGRIYDPALGRMMSADPFVQQPDNLQDYNRYSYVNNNPLMYTDPSGYLKLGKLFKIAAAVAIAVWAPQFIGNALNRPGIPGDSIS